MKQNKTLFNQIFEKFQTLNEADEQSNQQQSPSPVQPSPSPVQPSQNEDADADFDDNSSDEVIEQIAKQQLQILQNKFKDNENKKDIIDKIIRKALGEGDGDENEAKELIERIKQSLGE